MLSKGSGLAIAIAFAAACSDGSGGSGGSGGGGTSDPYPEVAGLDRGPGMPIGQGAAGPGDERGLEALPANPTTNPTQEVDIPTFDESIEGELSVPCGGCVELNVVVNDINQRNDFEFTIEEAAITRIVWTLVTPFNSDQLFIRSLINGVTGPYRQLHVNDFPIDIPFEAEQIYFGAPATRIGMSMGSSGAWTGNQPMRLFVDEVTMELEDGSTRTYTFDEGLEGMAARTEERQAHVVHHPLE
jgi:hypothetical protein